MPIEIISPIVQIVQKFQASNMSQFPFKGTLKITVFFFFPEQVLAFQTIKLSY